MGGQLRKPGFEAPTVQASSVQRNFKNQVRMSFESGLRNSDCGLRIGKRRPCTGTVREPAVETPALRVGPTESSQSGQSSQVQPSPTKSNQKFKWITPDQSGSNPRVRPASKAGGGLHWSGGMIWRRTECNPARQRVANPRRDGQARGLAVCAQKLWPAKGIGPQIKANHSVSKRV
jgi:hypothetical protein